MEPNGIELTEELAKRRKALSERYHARIEDINKYLMKGPECGEELLTGLLTDLVDASEWVANYNPKTNGWKTPTPTHPSQATPRMSVEERDALVSVHSKEDIILCGFDSITTSNYYAVLDVAFSTDRVVYSELEIVNHTVVRKQRKEWNGTRLSPLMAEDIARWIVYAGNTKIIGISSYAKPICEQIFTRHDLTLVVCDFSKE